MISKTFCSSLQSFSAEQNIHLRQGNFTKSSLIHAFHGYLLFLQPHLCIFPPWHPAGMFISVCCAEVFMQIVLRICFQPGQENKLFLLNNCSHQWIFFCMCKYLMNKKRYSLAFSYQIWMSLSWWDNHFQKLSGFSLSPMFIWSHRNAQKRDAEYLYIYYIHIYYIYFI